MTTFRYFSMLALIAIAIACGTTVTPKPEFRGFVAPASFPTPTYNFTNNPVTENGFALGKKLFYDGRLSRNGTISCGSCHISYSAFTHHGHDVSHGIDDKLGTRNAPAVQNMAWMDMFFWDGGVHQLDMLSFNPIANPVEMDESVANVLEKLKQDAQYPKMFKAAFGSEEINSMRMMQALSQFMCMLISANSKYDQYKQGKVEFSAAEKRGLDLFQQKCATCHSGELFTDQSFRNNGLATTADSGRAHITLNASDRYKFKVPSLRNVGKTAPYMHDGRLGTLNSVLNHYQKNVQQTPNLDPLLTNGISMTDAEKADIIEFLYTLSDETFVRDTLFAE